MAIQFVPAEALQAAQASVNEVNEFFDFVKKTVAGSVVATTENSGLKGLQKEIAELEEATVALAATKDEAFEQIEKYIKEQTAIADFAEGV